MINVYSQTSGFFWDNRGEAIATGYSGFGEAKNNQKFQSTRDIGPIPRGLWTIGEPYDSSRVGPFALPLLPSDHDAFGRTEFLIHGDSIARPGTASRGCIILPRHIREFIHASNCRLLMVIE